MKTLVNVARYHLVDRLTYVALPWPGVRPADPARADAIGALMRHLQGPEARSQFANAAIEPTP